MFFVFIFIFIFFGLNSCHFATSQRKKNTGETSVIYLANFGTVTTKENPERIVLQWIVFWEKTCKISPICLGAKRSNVAIFRQEQFLY